MEKGPARAEILGLEKALDPSLRILQDQSISRYLDLILSAPWWQDPDREQSRQTSHSRGMVAGFVPGGREPDFLEVLASHAASGMAPVVGLVRTSGPDQVMSLRLWSGDLSALSRHPVLSLREASASLEELVPRPPCLVLVPGLAFAPDGSRLGRGGGYYDRFLAAWPGCFRLGICREFQVRESLPADPHDQSMDAILTEKGLRFCRVRKELNMGDDFARLFQYLVEKKPGIDLIHHQGE